MSSRWLDIDQVLLLLVYGPTRSPDLRTRKKERGQYPTILTEKTWSIKDLLYGFRGNFSRGIEQVVPSRNDGSILPVWEANCSVQFGSSCLLAELATSKFSERNTSYNLRDSENKLNVRLPRTNYFKNSFSYTGATLWNHLPYVQ